MIFQGTSGGVSLQVPASNVIGIEELPVNAETCLALNRTYQELVLDSLQKIEVALGENRDRQVRTINTLYIAETSSSHWKATATNQMHGVKFSSWDVSDLRSLGPACLLFGLISQIWKSCFLIG